MERSVPLCVVVLILCYNVHILEASYAYITVNPTETRIGVNLTMACKYNGSFTVNSIFWEKNSAGVQIRLISNCVPANIPDSTVYNMNRTAYNCDQGNNIYSLILNNLVAEDDGNTWSCSLRLSAGNSTDPVTYIIRLPSTTTATSTTSPPTLIQLLIPLLVCVGVPVVVIFLILICCGCLDCCKLCRIFDHYKERKCCYVTWYFIKRGCCSFFFCKSGSKRGKCFCGYSTGEPCGGCLSCRQKCRCGWPGNCKSKEICCYGCWFCFCCVEEDEVVNEVNVDLNTKMSGSRSAVSRKDVELRMGEKDVKNDEERLPVFHLGTKHKVESETAIKRTRNFDSDERRPLPPLGGDLEDKPKHHPQPRHPENSDVKDRNPRGLSANYDDTRGLPTETPRSSRLPPLLVPIQPTVEEEVALEEPKKKKKKKKKKKNQMNEGNPEEEIAELERKRKSSEDQVVSDED